MTFPFQQQQNEMDCGPTCLYMISRYFGRTINLETIRKNTELGKNGVNLYGISNAAEKIGLRTLSVEISFEKLIDEAPLPCIVHWEQNHFVVVTPQSRINKVVVADPAHGIIKYSKKEFCLKWLNTTDEVQRIALLIEPTPDFFNQTETKKTGLSWGFLLQYLKQYKKYFIQLVIGLLYTNIYNI